MRALTRENKQLGSCQGDTWLGLLQVTKHTQGSRSSSSLLALSKFGGQTEKCGRSYFPFADFASLSGDAGWDELQTDLGRQRGQVGSVQVRMVRICGEEQRRLGRCDHNS